MVWSAKSGCHVPSWALFVEEPGNALQSSSRPGEGSKRKSRSGRKNGAVEFSKVDVADGYTLPELLNFKFERVNELSEFLLWV